MRVTIGSAAFDLVRDDDGGWKIDRPAVLDGQRVRVSLQVTPLEDKPYDLLEHLNMSADALAQAMSALPITRAEVGRGGVNLGLVVQLEGGLRAMLKPTQVNPHAMPRHEVAAYRIARAVGLPNVPPTILREVSYDELCAPLPASLDFCRHRIKAEGVFDVDGRTLASVMAWAPQLTAADVVSLEATRQRRTWLSLDSPLDEAHRPRIAQYSSAIVFDVLINNDDRWVGGNMLVARDGQSTIWIDHGDAFGHQPVKTRTIGQLRRCQRFSRRLVEAVRALDHASLDAALRNDPPLLDDGDRNAVMQRRDAVLAHVDGLVNAHGDAAVLAFD